MTEPAANSADALLSDEQFEELAAGRLPPEALARLRREVQAVLDDPDDSISHDAVWSGLEQRMKRAVSRAA